MFNAVTSPNPPPKKANEGKQHMKYFQPGLKLLDIKRRQHKVSERGIFICNRPLKETNPDKKADVFKELKAQSIERNDRVTSNVRSR